MYPGRCGTLTYDYKRNRTTTLFAAIKLAEGRLIGTCMLNHRRQEWIKLLKLIDAETPADRELHLIVDKYATHKHPKMKPWLNLIERWFLEITDNRIRRGSFHSVKQLIEANEDFIDHHNANPQSYAWTAQVEDILAKVSRARAVLDKIPTE